MHEENLSSVVDSAWTYSRIRERHTQEMERVARTHLERLAWSSQQLREERLRRLRALLQIARERSSWHRRRLAHIDPAAVQEEDLGAIPVMTKDDLMQHFDEIVTDPRLTLDLVETHLAGLTADAYLLDQYHAAASGGSSGRRGVFVYDWPGWIDAWLGCFRYLLRDRLRTPELMARPLVLGGIAADSATHMSSSLPQTFGHPASVTVHRFPIDLPLNGIVEGLNETQPDVLLGYPSALHLLAVEANEKRLAITPWRIVSVAEPLFPETRALLEKTWPASVLNWYGSSEGGGMAISCGRGPGLHLSDDLVIVEPVDRHGRSVPPGVRSSKLYLTNLFNHALPLIRYELTDEVTLMDEACACGSQHRLIAEVQGRLDESFSYSSIGTVHPHVLRSRLGHERSIVEYQVRQTPRGVSVFVRCHGELAIEVLHGHLTKDLQRLGLTDPEVSVTQVEHLERHSSGKLKRFVPLAIT